MCRKRLVLLFLCVAPGGLRSQEPVYTGSIQDIYNHLSSVLAGTESVDFHGTHHLAMTEASLAFEKKPGQTAPFALDGDTRFRGRGAKYCFTMRSTTNNGYAPSADTYAWDGKYYQVLTLKDGYLYVSTRNPAHTHLRMFYCSALNMFGFLLPQSPPGQLSVGWDLVKNLNAWETCLASARLIGPVTFHGKPCSAVTIPNVEHRAPDMPRCTYTVYFSWNDGMFPMAWKIEDEHHWVLEDYEVEEFGQAPCGAGQVFYYPKRVVGNFHQIRDLPPDKPEATYTSAYDSFRLNTVKDDDVFTVDRATTQQVYNGDTGVCTPTHPPVRGPNGNVIAPP